MKVEIWTDGACSGNPGPGGWGAVLIREGKKEEISGAQQDATNNQMELKAVIEALKTLTELTDKCEVEIYTDSTYVKDGMTMWIQKWELNNYKNAKNKTIKNKELWVELNQLSTRHNIKWHWVRGHVGNPLNERADELATNAILTLANHANHP